MKDFRILKILDHFSFLYKLLGIDYLVMRKILQIKLLMDQRRAPSVLINSSKKDQDNALNKSLIMYGVIGFFIMMFIFVPFPLFYKMNIISGLIIFMLLMIMISDFSTALLDIKDKSILLSKPISLKTINAAKITHIILNLLAITTTLVGPLLIAGFFKYGLQFVAVLLIELLLISSFVLFFTSILYFLILQLFDGDKVKDMINYFQILFTLLLMIGYQFMGRIFSVIGINITFSFHWWVYLLPSAWFAAPFSLALEKNMEPYVLYLSAIGVIVPILLLTLYLKIIINYFEKSLYKLERAGSRKRNLAEKRAVISKKMLSVISPNHYENVFCRFAQNMVSSDRIFKLRLYPFLGLAAFLPFIVLINTLRENVSLHVALTNISGGSSYLSVYMTVFALATITANINTSEKFKGAWIYKALPVKTPGIILRGALKGFVLKYIIPVYFFVCLVFAFIYGAKLIPHALLILLNLLLLIVLIFTLTPKELPFSSDIQVEQGNKFGVVIGALAFCGLSAALHYNLQAYNYGLHVYMIAVFIITAFLWKRSSKILWKDLV